MLVGVLKHRWMTVVVAVSIASVALALPAAADLDLIAGDWAEVAYTAGDGVNVREAPDPDAAIVAGLPEGFGLTIEDGPVEAWDGSVWYAVRAEMEDGSVDGWVSADFLSVWQDGASDGIDGPVIDSSAASGVPLYVNTGGEWLNVRSEPSPDAGVVTSIPDGAEVEILAPVFFDDEGTGWSRVSYDGVVGYSVSSYLESYPAGRESLDDGMLLVSGTGGDGLSLRAWPAADGDLLTVLDEGTFVWLLDGPVTDDVGESWYQIEADGLVGWSHGAYLGATGGEMALAGASTTGAALVEAALGYLGVPYVWGGTTPDGFDCSGFTWFIVSNVVDASFPRPNEDQAVSGFEVGQGDLIPGDLIFFQNTYQWGLSHVGIYLGDGQFVSASGEHDAVGISSLSDPYWATRYLTARRVT
jgi:cell wall-associated NlpC family hydrolase